MIEGKKLRNPAAHGVAANNRALQTKMIENRRGIICEHLCAVFNRGFAGQARAAVIEDNDSVVRRKLRNLEKIPHRAVACGLTEK